MTDRWDQRTLLALPVGARRYKDGVLVKRTGTGLSWYAVFRVPVAPGVKTSKVVQEHLPSVDNVAQARAVRDLRRGQVFTGTYAPRAEYHSLASFFDRFCELKADLRTLYKYKKQLKRVWIPVLGSRAMDTVTPGDVQAVYQKRIGEGAALATARSEVAALKSYYSTAQRDGKATTNPAKLVKTRTPNNARKRLLTDSEMVKLFEKAEARTDYVRPLFFLLYFTGRRISEALEIRWSSVQLENGCIRFVDAKSDEVQLCPIHPRLRAELVRWQALAVDDHLFPSPTKKGAAMKQPTALREMLQDIGADITPHTMRHNLVSQKQRKGVSVNVVAQYTGQKTLATIFHYSHANSEIIAETIDVMPVPGQTPGKQPTPPVASQNTYQRPDIRKKLRKIASRTR